MYMEETHHLDKRGIARLELYPPVNSTNETALRIEVKSPLVFELLQETLLFAFVNFSRQNTLI